MNVECTKIKRTGFAWIFLAGGAFGAAIPVLNTAFRTEIFLDKALGASPVRVLMEANWQMIAMINLLLVILGAAILYHIEYDNNGIQRMDALPVRPMKLFDKKLVLLVCFSLLSVILEMAGMLICLYVWFLPGAESLAELGRYAASEAMLMLPVTVLMLAVSSVCRNMWITLGIGVIGIFYATIMMSASFWITLVPFSMPFKLLPGMERGMELKYAAAAAAQTALFLAVSYILQNRRRDAS